MDRHYIILLDRAGRVPTGHFRGKSEFEQPFDMASRLMEDPPQPAIHRERLSAQELEELAQEPGFIAAAEVMKTNLLAPVEEEVSEDKRGLVAPCVGTRRQSWGVSAVGADKSKFIGANVTVAMLDTGIDRGHEAFRGVDLVEKDFTGYGVGDLDGHGTHCAGILFGRNVGGVRIGIAPGVNKALIGKIVGPDGGDSDMMVRAMCWAHEQGARVISMSVGFDFASTVEERIAEGWPVKLATSVTLEAYRANLRLLDRLLQMLRMQEPRTGGAIIVAAAGNDSNRGPGGEFIMGACPPAGSDKIISVGSLDPSANGAGYRVSSFSNSGVEIAAPGRGIVSARVGGGLRVLSGTSVAAPHVAGVAALWWQAVRQSELPANATLVRGRLLGGAESRGFSLSVHPADRGAGRAVAPRDGFAVSMGDAPLNPPRRSPSSQVGELALSARAESIMVDSGMEAIAAGGGSSGVGTLRTRRDLC